jgi:hypothetical protein
MSEVTGRLGNIVSVFQRPWFHIFSVPSVLSVFVFAAGTAGIVITPDTVQPWIGIDLIGITLTGILSETLSAISFSLRKKNTNAVPVQPPYLVR